MLSHSLGTLSQHKSGLPDLCVFNADVGQARHPCERERKAEPRPTPNRRPPAMPSARRLMDTGIGPSARVGPLCRLSVLCRFDGRRSAERRREGGRQTALPQMRIPDGTRRGDPACHRPEDGQTHLSLHALQPDPELHVAGDGEIAAAFEPEMCCGAPASRPWPTCGPEITHLG